MWATLDLGYWLCLLLAVPAAGFLVRLFMIQHDCGHGAFFRHRRCQRLGRTRDRGADAHALRLLATHSCHSPLDFRQSRSPRNGRHRHADRAGVPRAIADGVGCATASTDTRSSCSAWARPICSSCSTGCRSASCAAVGSPGSAPWRPTLAIAAIVATMIWLIGVGPFLLVHLPIMLLAASVGRLAVLCPAPVRGHRLGSRRSLESAGGRRFTAAPTMHLPGTLALVHRQYRRLTTSIICAAGSPATDCHSCCATTRTSSGIGRLTLLQSFRCVRLVLWDEDQQRLVSFRDVRRNDRSV